MQDRAAFLASRFAALNGRRNGSVVLRMISRLGGPDPAPNPPRFAGLVADGAHLVGAGTLNLRGTALAGRIIVGDRFAVGGNVVRATAQAIATEANTCAVALAVGLAAGIADGAVVVPTWVAEKTVAANVLPFATRLVDGTLILERDLQVIVAAADLPGPPRTQWSVVLPDGDEREVVNFRAKTVAGVPISYELQVR